MNRSAQQAKAKKSGTQSTHARKRFVFRTRIIFGALVLIALLLTARLYFLQIVQGEDFRIRAQDQYVSATGGFYDRGSIFFRDKDGRKVSGATIKTGYTLAIKPLKITEPEKLYERLRTHVELDKEEFFSRARKENDPYEEVAHQLDAETISALNEMDLDGVVVVPERWRYYPGHTLAAHTLGFVAYDGSNDLQGRYGLERYYEDVLARGESNVYINFFAELFTNLREVVFVPAEKREGHIVTTIEPSVQLYLENVLSDMKEEWSSEFTAGIVIDPQTGAIVALGATPSFDLNAFNEADVSFANPLVERIYEMGSIMKPLTIAAGLDAGAINADTTYNDRGTRTFDGYTISNYDGKARGIVPVQEILSQSLNTGVAFAVEEMGKETFRRYMYRYGVHEETGIDLPNEAKSQTDNLESPRDIEYATASYGQGIALTPITTVRALSILPDGYAEQPHVVSEIHSQSGLSHTVDYSDVREQVFAPETAEEITRMLVEVVDEALLGGSVKMDRYSIAAKTGTAQVASAQGGYSEDTFLHSFFGYFPAYDAKFLVFLMNMDPKGAQYASETLTHPFMDITQYLINYYDIPPDR